MPHNEYTLDQYHEGEAALIPTVARDSNDNRVDISGATIEYHLKDEQATDDGSADVTKTVAGGGITIVDGAAGEFEIKIDGADTDGLVPQGETEESMWHNCWIVKDGDALVVFHGDVLVTHP